MQTEKIKNYVLARLNKVLMPPIKNLKHPFTVPGTGYMTELWSWDAYWECVALKRSLELFGEEQTLRFGISEKSAFEHMRGNVLNFLDAQEQNGFIPIMLSHEGLFDGFFQEEYKKGTPLNNCLPFLCQMALLADIAHAGGFDVEKLIKYMQYFERYQYDERSGLFVWQDDIMIGIDNNPTVFYRPQKSGADVYLNSFIYLEYSALAKILKSLSDCRSDEFFAKAERLKKAINAEMWDEEDGIYYSQDVGFYKTERIVKGVALHSGLDPHWNSMPLKIRFWGCFLPMYAGICSDEQALRMCEHLERDDKLFAPFGIRTVAKNEKMYSLAKSGGNPSNWLGPIWVVANYCVYKGLVRYNKTKLAEKLKNATFALLNDNLEKYGEMFESYHPDTGEPFMHPGFLSHNSCVMDMF